MQRRSVLSVFMAGMASLASIPSSSQPNTRMGIVLYALKHRRLLSKRKKEQPNLDDPIRFLAYCHSLGAGGVQIPFGIRDKNYINQFRALAEKRDMFFEAILPAPNADSEVERFRKMLVAAKDAGAKVLRTVIMPGRRYERFASMDAFRHFEKKALQSVQRMAPLVEKHKMRLAIENHKDQRVEERLRILEQCSSEYVGVCFDVGNSFALLEDPVEVAEAFASRTFTVHIKDQAVREYEEGFLFADVALGEGILDLPAIMKVLRRANSHLCYSLESITRDPLKVPCLRDSYWRTMRHVSGQDLARVLRRVKAHPTREMEMISQFPIQQRVRVEHETVVRSLAYARKNLEL
ncbi:TIM barrel protein [bacterium]|nr:TIM barrel protein [bacterium]